MPYPLVRTAGLFETSINLTERGFADRVLSSDFEFTVLRRIRSFLSAAVPSLSEDALLEHYLRHLHPVMPLLPISPQHTLDSIPPSLRAIITVESLSSFPEHRAAGVHAWRLIKEEKVGDRMLEQPRLSSLATAALELSTTLDPRGDYGLLAKVRLFLYILQQAPR